MEPDLLTNAPLFGKIYIVTKFIDLAQEYGMDSFNLNVYWWAGQLDIYFIVNAEDNFWPACGQQDQENYSILKHDNAK